MYKLRFTVLRGHTCSLGLELRLVKLHLICKKAAFSSMVVLCMFFFCSSDEETLSLRRCTADQIRVSLIYSKHKDIQTWTEDWPLSCDIGDWLKAGWGLDSDWLPGGWGGIWLPGKHRKGSGDGEPSTLILQLCKTKTQSHLFKFNDYRRYGPV